MLRGQIELKNRERAEIALLAAFFLQTGGEAVQLETTARADLGRGRDRLRRLYIIKPDGKEAKPMTNKTSKPKAARDREAVMASARRAAEANSAARKAERDALAGAVQECAASGMTRKRAAECLGISPNNLRRITTENSIHFARDRAPRHS